MSATVSRKPSLQRVLDAVRLPGRDAEHAAGEAAHHEFKLTELLAGGFTIDSTLSRTIRSESSSGRRWQD
jgi:hypothetical protein